MSSGVILPPATLGMLGGGQLGRFFVAAAHEMGYQVCVLDPDPNSPAGQIAERHFCVDYDDYAALDEFAAGCAAITTEFENVPAATLDYLAKFVPVHPSAAAVAICQQRIAEKSFLRDNGLPHGPFAEIGGEDDIKNAPAELFPAILKVARFGYDGKGQATVNCREEALLAFAHFKCEPCVLEQRLMLDYEVSVVLARDANGQVQCFPTSETNTLEAFSMSQSCRHGRRPVCAAKLRRWRRRSPRSLATSAPWRLNSLSVKVA
jgi:5-(carboxyamino)imidazole ribonucleotide synthase